FPCGPLGWFLYPGFVLKGPDTVSCQWTEDCEAGFCVPACRAVSVLSRASVPEEVSFKCGRGSTRFCCCETPFGWSFISPESLASWSRKTTIMLWRLRP